ncbi:mucin-2-like [Sycon ciliatum]|uniref:mucin-2-like n=1 Tax=Sycon ciliatum TaxID=27933 RepID=UPI0031F70406
MDGMRRRPRGAEDGESETTRDGTLSIRHDVIDDVTDSPVSDVLPATMPSSVAMTATTGGSPELQSLTKVHSNLRQFLDASQAEHSAMNAIASTALPSRLSLSPISPPTDQSKPSHFMLSETETEASVDGDLSDGDECVRALQKRTEQLLLHLHQSQPFDPTASRVSPSAVAAGRAADAVAMSSTARATGIDSQPLQSTQDLSANNEHHVNSNGTATYSTLLASSLRVTPVAGHSASLASKVISPPAAAAAAAAASADASLTAENSLLRQSVERERLRRKTCEKKIHGLHEKLLGTQQQLAMALAQRRKRESMLQQLDKNLVKLASGWQEREGKSAKVTQRLAERLDQLKVEKMQQAEVLEQTRLQLTHNQQSLQEERKRAETARQSLAAEVQRLSSEHAATMHQLAAEREHSAQLDVQLGEALSRGSEHEQRHRELEMWVNEFKARKTDEEGTALKEEKEHHRLQEESLHKQIQTLKAEMENRDQQLGHVKDELSCVQQERDKLIVDHAVEIAKTQATADKALEQARQQLDRQMVDKTSQWKEELLTAETHLREHNRSMLEDVQSQHHKEIQAVTNQYKKELSDMDTQLNTIEKKYTEKLLTAQKALQAEMTAKQNIAQEKSLLSVELQEMLRKQCDDVIQILSASDSKLDTSMHAAPTAHAEQHLGISDPLPAAGVSEQRVAVTMSMADALAPGSLQQVSNEATIADQIATQRPGNASSAPDARATTARNIATPTGPSWRSGLHQAPVSTVAIHSGHAMEGRTPTGSPHRQADSSSSHAPVRGTASLQQSPIVALSDRYSKVQTRGGISQSSAHPSSVQSAALPSSTGDVRERRAKEQLALLLSRINGQAYRASAGGGGGAGGAGGGDAETAQTGPAVGSGGAQPLSAEQQSSIHHPSQTSQCNTPRVLDNAALIPRCSGDGAAATTTSLATSSSRTVLAPHTNSAFEHHASSENESDGAGSGDRTVDGESSDAMEMSTVSSSFVERLQAHQSRQNDLLSYLEHVLQTSPRANTATATTAGTNVTMSNSGGIAVKSDDSGANTFLQPSTAHPAPPAHNTGPSSRQGSNGSEMHATPVAGPPEHLTDLSHQTGRDQHAAEYNAVTSLLKEVLGPLLSQLDSHASSPPMMASSVASPQTPHVMTSHSSGSVPIMISSVAHPLASAHVMTSSHSSGAAPPIMTSWDPSSADATSIHTIGARDPSRHSASTFTVADDSKAADFSDVDPESCYVSPVVDTSLPRLASSIRYTAAFPHHHHHHHVGESVTATSGLAATGGETTRQAFSVLPDNGESTSPSAVGTVRPGTHTDGVHIVPTPTGSATPSTVTTSHASLTADQLTRLQEFSRDIARLEDSDSHGETTQAPRSTMKRITASLPNSSTAVGGGKLATDPVPALGRAPVLVPMSPPRRHSAGLGPLATHTGLAQTLRTSLPHSVSSAGEPPKAAVMGEPPKSAVKKEPTSSVKSKSTSKTGNRKATVVDSGTSRPRVKTARVNPISTTATSSARKPAKRNLSTEFSRPHS